MPKRVWTAEQVLEEILDLEKSGVDLRHGAVQGEYKRLVSAAIRYFGSWRAAVQAAGLDYESLRASAEELRLQKIGKWSEDRILDEIRSLLGKGEDLRAVIIKNKYPALFSAAVSPRYFTNWRKALTAAGVDYDQVLSKSPRGRPRRSDIWHTNLILDMVREMIEENSPLDQESIANNHPRLLRLATSRFGSWQNAIVAAKSDDPIEE